MRPDPATYWSQAHIDGNVEKWSRHARRKMRVWRATYRLAAALRSAMAAFIRRLHPSALSPA